MNSIRKTLQIICGFFIMISSACAAHDHHTFISYSYIGEFTAAQAKLAVEKSAPLNTLPMNYNFKLYKVLYKTPAVDGTPMTASGLVAMPISPLKQVDIVSYQHGTRFFRDDAPTANVKKNFIYPAIFTSSGGYLLSMPDYLGLGDNELKIQPYVDAKTLASASIDMLFAAKELAAKLQYPVSDKLFLTGYSEGGFSTMVMYETLLKSHPEIHVTAAAPGSAPYDWNETMKFVVDGDGPRSSAYLGLFYYSVQLYHHYWSGADAIFKKPYDSLIPYLYDGSHTNEEILSGMPKNPHDLLQDKFMDIIRNGTEPHLPDLIANFNHYDFKSTSPLLLIGTKGDHDVPYHGAEIAYETLKKKSNEVYIRSVSDNLDHIQAFPYITKEQLEFFEQYGAN